MIEMGKWDPNIDPSVIYEKLAMASHTGVGMDWDDEYGRVIRLHFTGGPNETLKRKKPLFSSGYYVPIDDGHNAKIHCWNLQAKLHKVIWEYKFTWELIPVKKESAKSKTERIVHDQYEAVFSAWGSPHLGSIMRESRRCIFLDPIDKELYSEALSFTSPNEGIEGSLVTLLKKHGTDIYRELAVNMGLDKVQTGIINKSTVLGRDVREYGIRELSEPGWILGMAMLAAESFGKSIASEKDEYFLIRVVKDAPEFTLSMTKTKLKCLKE